MGGNFASSVASDNRAARAESNDSVAGGQARDVRLAKVWHLLASRPDVDADPTSPSTETLLHVPANAVGRRCGV